MASSFGCIATLAQILIILGCGMGVAAVCGIYHLSSGWSAILIIGTLAGSVYLGMISIGLFARWLSAQEGKDKKDYW
jgi:hypothetical protein